MRIIEAEKLADQISDWGHRGLIDNELLAVLKTRYSTDVTLGGTLLRWLGFLAVKMATGPEQHYPTNGAVLVTVGLPLAFDRLHRSTRELLFNINASHSYLSGNSAISWHIRIVSPMYCWS